MNKKVIVFAAAASVVLIGVWYLLVFSPQGKSIHQANNEAAAANQQAATLRSDIALLQQEKAQLPASTDKLAALKLALPDTPALDKLVDDITAAAAATGVDWQTVTPAKPATYAAGSSQAVAAGAAGGLQVVNVVMQVNGSTRQLLDFVTKLNGMSRLLAVTAVNLSGSTGPKATAQLTTQMFFVPAGAGSVPVTTTTVPKA